MYCKICNNTDGNQTFIASENMFKMACSFEYSACSLCGSLQIVNIPDNLSEFYPENYYSFHLEKSIEPFLKRYLKQKKLSFHLFGKSLIGRIILKYKKNIPEFASWLKYTPIKFNDAILDVGCGNGALLCELYNYNYRNITGLDPFGKEEYKFRHFKILNTDLFSLNEQFDLIMFHHSLEHMDQPHKVFSKIISLLRPEGYLIINIPLADSYAWKHYKENWVQLDAPRHLILYTRKAMNMLAEKHKLKKIKIINNSYDFQFWGSELYLKNIGLQEYLSWNYEEQLKIFPKEVTENYQRMAKELNDKEFGDSAMFIFQK